MNYLDANFNLFNSTYKPHYKENKNIKFINFSSNHPKSIKETLIENVSRKISSLASNKAMLVQSADYYKRTLEIEGYNKKIEFKPNMREEEI